ncbi:hypothetical protein F1559_005176 [Cyanidiococcus yangmingshanensis]|uniref:Uncharacterized protein n=1 Tax=Cyanidiococcus yangmingshanensis TaxID=2690220 RepID=A0A7J7ICX1_9RHOD|nr:hypothetical protein F1559_005176 [Cyanidiococcus yangmingshanensis]
MLTDTLGLEVTERVPHLLGIGSVGERYLDADCLQPQLYIVGIAPIPANRNGSCRSLIDSLYQLQQGEPRVFRDKRIHRVALGDEHLLQGLQERTPRSWARRPLAHSPQASIVQAGESVPQHSEYAVAMLQWNERCW